MKKHTLLLLALLLRFALGASVLASAPRIRFGVYENYPLVFTDEDGRASGIFVDVLEYVADKEGWTIEYVHGDWADLLGQLERGETDLIGAIAYTEARSALFDFSAESVITNWGQIYTRPDAEIASILDLEGKTLAVLEADIHAEAAKNLLEGLGVSVHLIEVKDYPSVFGALQKGEADAGVVNRLVAIQYARVYDVSETNIIFNPIKNRYASTKGVHQDLLAALDANLRALKADDDSVYYQSLDRWFGGVSRWRMPEWMPWAGLIFGGLLLTFAVASLVLRYQVRARMQELQAQVIEREQAEEALRETQEIFSTFMDYLPASAFIKDGDSRVLYVNKQMIERFGAENWTDQTPEELFPGEVGKVMRASDLKALEEGYCFEEEKVRDVQGNQHTYWTQKFRLEREGKEPLLGGIALDITERVQAEEALRESEERFRRAILEAPFPMMLHAEDGEVILINKVWTEITDYSDGDILTIADWTERAYGEKKSLVRADIDRLYDMNTRVDEGEYTITTSSGGERTWHFSSAPLGALPDGRRLVLSIAADITERRQRERELQEAERRFRTLLDNVRLVAVGLDEEGNVAYANPYLLELTGYKPDDILGQSWFQTFIPERDRPAVGAVFSEILEAGIHPHYENSIVTKGGKERLIAWNNTLLLGPNSKPVGTMSIGEDITERKRAEEELQESEEKFRTLVDQTVDMLLLHDMDGKIIDVNRSSVEQYGYTREELLSMKVADLDPDYVEREDGGQFWDEFDRNEWLRFEAQQKRKNGSIFSVEVTVSKVTLQGEGYILGLCRDITERVQAEEELRKHREHLEELVVQRTAELNERVAEVEQLNLAMANLLEDLQATNRDLEETGQQLQRTNAELETFTYSVSHDLKAPLRGIDGYSRLLLEDHADHLDEEGRHFLHTIRRAADQMSQLIEDLLAYSRLERRSLTTGRVNPLALVEALVAERAGEIEKRGVQMTVNVSCGAVLADAESLTQALRNLLDNALKFTREASEPEIEIGGRETEKSCILWVRDNGIGFDMKYHDRIFDIFQRLHRDEDYPGTGVGLAIVHKAAERMGGHVWTESAPGQGATFYLEIPR